MAQGFKKKTQKKQKMVLAKDKNQLITAIIVMCFFFGYTAFNLIKYFNEQQMYSSPPQAQQVSAGFPIWIVVLIIIVLLVILGVVGFVMKNKNLDNLINSSKQASTDNKKPGTAGKMAFAKNKNELVLAVAVLIVFFVIITFNIVKYFQNQTPPSTVSSQTAQDLALQQRKNLEAMGNPNAMSSEEPMINPNQMDSQMGGTIPVAPGEENGSSTVQTSPSQMGNTSSDDGIDVISRKNLIKGKQKRVLISVDNSGRQNPFLPANEMTSIAGISNLPYLTPPPETLPIQSDAGKVMTTTISGILYDKYNPSAIINIEGTDYLVKKGDTINSYRVLSIRKTEVIVQLGKNIYKAGVGELLTQTNMNYNTIANLNKKFGGNEVSINVKKKGY